MSPEGCDKAKWKQSEREKKKPILKVYFRESVNFKKYLLEEIKSLCTVNEKKPIWVQKK